MTEKIICDNCTDKGHCPEYEAGAVCVNDRNGINKRDMTWDDFKSINCQTVIHCNSDTEKQEFINAAKDNGIFPNLAPFAIRKRSHFKCVRSNGRLELGAYPINQVVFWKFKIIEWKDFREDATNVIC